MACQWHDARKDTIADGEDAVKENESKEKEQRCFPLISAK